MANLFDVFAEPIAADRLAERTIVEPGEWRFVVSFRVLGMITAEALADLEELRRLAHERGHGEVAAIVDRAIHRLTGDPVSALIEASAVGARARRFGAESDYG